MRAWCSDARAFLRCRRRARIETSRRPASARARSRTHRRSHHSDGDSAASRPKTSGRVRPISSAARPPSDEPPRPVDAASGARAVARVDPGLQLVDEKVAVGAEPAAGTPPRDRGSACTRRGGRRRRDRCRRGSAARSAPRPDQRLGRLVEAPVLPRHEGARRVEEVLSVLQVEHGIARRRRRRSRAAGRSRCAASCRAPRERKSCRRSNRPVSCAPGSASPRTIDAGPTSAVIVIAALARRPRALYYRAMPVIEPGQKAPAFSLPDQHGKIHTLAGYAGRPRRALLLPEGRHLGLHQGSVHLPGDAAALRHVEGRGARRQRARHATARRSSRRSTA